MTLRSDKGYLSWLRFLYVALAYFIAGKLSYFSVIHPGYDAAIWPASGVALASVLLYGYRIWPSIFLGAFIINGLIAPWSNQVLECFLSLLVTLVISAGASLQAVLGAYLVQRFAEFPNEFVKGNKVFLFFFYGGGFSALVNSTLSVGILVLTGRTPALDVLYKWAIWWIGDFLGILIFAPLVLVWLWPLKSWITRRLTLSLTVCALFSITAVGVYSAKRHGHDELKGDFNLQASAMKSALEKNILAHLNTLYSLERFYASSDNVNRQEFQSFVSHYKDEIKSIQSLSWSPIIYEEDRQGFINSIRFNGLSNFQITEYDFNNKLVSSGQRKFYVPVSFMDSFSGNEVDLGFDNYSDAKRRLVFEQAMLSANIAMSGPLTLGSSNNQLKSIIAVMPIYKHGLPYGTIADREKNISSYVSIEFFLDKVAHYAFDGLIIENIAYRAVDKGVVEGDQLLFQKHWDLAYSTKQQEVNYFGEKFFLQGLFTIPVGNRLWQFEVVPTQPWLIFHHHHYDEIVLLSGLILTGIAGAFIWVVSGREMLLNDQVQERSRQSQFIAHLDRQRSLGAMAASLGHELNQPLTAIMTNAQVAQRGLEKGRMSPELLSGLLEKVIFNVRRTNLIIEKIRGFIEPSQMERSSVDIVAVVKESLEFLTQDLMAAHISVQFFVDDEELFVLGDALQLSQVILNIYRNAVEVLQFSEVRNLFVTIKYIESWVVLTIADSGPGFTKDALERVSTPFYTTKANGLGLGLSISKDIIEQHHGRLLISNAEQGGACFEIRLPVSEG